MQSGLKQRFIALWRKYFDGAELPIVFYYTDDKGHADSAKPGSVPRYIGMFDPSARPFVPENVLTFSVPMKRFIRMIDNMEEGFLITDTWKRIQKRISPADEKD